MQLNFFREDEGSAPDQPFFTDWVEFQLFHKNEFGAIIGDPVSHSWTPEEHRENWERNGCNPLRIQISREEWKRDHLEFLKSLGLKFAAITSPLKELFFQNCDDVTEVARDLGSVNTLKIEKNKVWGHNTDLEGLRTVLEKLQSKEHVAIWGGGGTLNVLKKLLPQADFFSARTGALREGDTSRFEYDLLIWAVGRSQEEWKFPEPKIQFKGILDLNYTDNSPGKELAQLRACKYTSGADMFYEQARLQKGFFKV